MQQDTTWDGSARPSKTQGAVQERYAYDPYGKPSFYDSSWNARVNSMFSWVYLHQGGRYDTNSGLYDFRNRDYSPTLGRWMQEDPAGYSTRDSNLYRFVWSDPLDQTDPSGLAQAAAVTLNQFPSVTV